jgi:hypothetical protein
VLNEVSNHTHEYSNHTVVNVRSIFSKVASSLGNKVIAVATHVEIGLTLHCSVATLLGCAPQASRTAMTTFAVHVHGAILCTTLTAHCFATMAQELVPETMTFPLVSENS